jgi:hypothetical protein
MSDMDARDEALLDRELSSYYGRLADAPVPVKLHGRIVRSLQARGAGRGFRRSLTRLAPAALVVLAVGAIAFAALPWAQRAWVGDGGPTASATASATTPQSPPATPSSISTPYSSGTIPITVLNRGASEVIVTIDGVTTGHLYCGETGTYLLSPSTARFEAAGDGNSDIVSFFAAPTPMWWIYRPGGWITADSPPPVDQTYSVCPKLVSGADPSGRFTWAFDEPVVFGTPSDGTINRSIDSAIQAWLGLFRESVLAKPSAKVRINATYSMVAAQPIVGNTWAPVRVMPLAIRFDSDTVKSFSWAGHLNFDMSDGHVIGVEELFTSPSAGLAALSRESRQRLGSDSFIPTADTAPTAASFARWTPASDGLLIWFQHGAGWPANRAFISGAEVTIPWSALDALIKPDSPVREFMP